MIPAARPGVDHRSTPLCHLSVTTPEAVHRQFWDLTVANLHQSLCDSFLHCLTQLRLNVVAHKQCDLMLVFFTCHGCHYVRVSNSVTFRGL